MTREQGKGNRGRGTVEVVELLPITNYPLPITHYLLSMKEG
ncbi:MAG: hypothetical protein ACKPFK_04745 [Dolichospermum sp.]